MDFLQFLNEVKMSSDEEVQALAASYEAHFSIREIQLLRPLLDEISFHWLFTGIPQHFTERVAQVIGYDRTDTFLQMYHDAVHKQ